MSVVSTNVLFAQCFEEEIGDVIDAFESEKVEAGKVVIQQGDQADKFYVIESGSFDVYVKAKGQVRRGGGRTTSEERTRRADNTGSSCSTPLSSPLVSNTLAALALATLFAEVEKFD